MHGADCGEILLSLDKRLNVEIHGSIFETGG